NYMDGFTNVAPQPELTEGVQTMRSFKPEHATQLEFGTKLNLFNDKLTATLSYYDIKVSDMRLRIDLDPNTYYFTQDGEQRNKGFETVINANPVNGLNLVAGYSYVDSNLEEGDPAFKDRRPESAGPLNTANLWADYQFTS